MVGGFLTVAVLAAHETSDGVDGIAARPEPTVDTERLSLSNPDCVRTVADATVTNVGCARSVAEASRTLGFDVARPTWIPAGWTRSRHVVRVFPAGGDSNPTGHDIGEYSQVWAPDGIDPDDPSPPYVQLLQRALLPGDACDPPNPLLLDDGTVVCGSLGVEPRTEVPGAFVWFVRDGVLYRLVSSGLPEPDVARLLNSLDR